MEKVWVFIIAAGVIAFVVGMLIIMFSDSVMSRFWGKFWEYTSMVLVIGGLVAALGGLLTVVGIWAFAS